MAASFPCARASTAQEKAICSDARLSALDERLGAAYDSIRKELSPDGAAKVKGDQLQWIKWLRVTCPDGTGHTPPADIASCLSGKYEARLKELQAGVLRLAGMDFFPR